MKKISKLFLSIVFASVLAFIGVNSASAMTLQEGAAAGRCSNCPTDLFGADGVFNRITDTLLYLVGLIAVVMLIWGGLRYVVSGGDAKKVTDAKNTILYAIIGLIISFFSYAIVHFVINSLPSSQNPNTTTNIQYTPKNV